MDSWLEGLGAKPAPESISKDLLVILARNPKFAPYVDTFKSCTLTVAQLSMLTYVMNEGVVIMTSADSDSPEAIHLQDPVCDSELTAMYARLQHLQNDELTTFEKELDLLTIDVDDAGDGRSRAGGDEGD